MARICLISCVSTKASSKRKASELYLSPLFKGAREFASKNFDRWYILSAKYGLVSPDTVIEPYEKTLNKMSRNDRINWAHNVFKRLKEATKTNDEITFIAGSRYREGLAPLLLERGNKICVPMEGLSIGKQLQWLSKQNNTVGRHNLLAEFYNLLKDLEKALGGRRKLKDSNGRMSWPQRGVYFFFEPGEYRRVNKDELRVVRVGTHMVSRGSKATLWNRLKTHRGKEDGGGNHRGSVFRLHVGNAMIQRSAGKISLPSWSNGQSASPDILKKESELEREVSEYIGNMSLLWLNIPDAAGPASDRAFIERNSIALLCNPKSPIDKPSKEWLGNFSPNDAIRKSGLWNVNYVGGNYDQRFLDVFARYVDAVAGQCSTPDKSIAPKDWYTADKGKDSRGQMFLFGEENV